MTVSDVAIVTGWDVRIIRRAIETGATWGLYLPPKDGHKNAAYLVAPERFWAWWDAQDIKNGTEMRGQKND